MDQMLAYIIIILFAIVGIVSVLNLGLPAVQSTQDMVQYSEAQRDMKIINNYITEVAAEGPGSSRLLKYDSKSQMDVIKDEEAVQFMMPSGAEIVSHLSRKISNNIIYISGNDVSCDSGGNLSMENSYLRVEFQKISGTINTQNNILLINEKTNGNIIYPINTSVLIDGNPATAYGTGYSELANEGSNLPVCYASFYVNSSAGIKYNIVYKLYAGADFLVAEVHNIR
jgi:Tfp pilus assembly major pilin PilA